MNQEALYEQLGGLPGKVSLYVRDVLTGEERISYQADVPLFAASVIKLPMMIALFDQVKRGKASWDEQFTVTRDVKVPSCGALTYLHDGLSVTLRDLCTLMIILSDNTATNMVYDRLGADTVNAVLRLQDCGQTTLRRKMFDKEAAQRGLENTVTAREIGTLLFRMTRGECVSPEADREMLNILLNQRLNGKIPFYLHGEGIPVAHKTGEDTGITHDVGVVYVPDKPFIACFLSNETDVPAFERFIQDTSLLLAKNG